MTADERKEEEEFLGELEARTGRTLAQWMALISAQGFADKNQTIDWLRGQGFPFARASWLERIHNNGGRPIYADDAARRAPAKPAAAAEPPTAPRARAPGDAALLEKLIAAAKGYRPLYQLLEAEVSKAFPSLLITPKPSYISLGAPREFAAITLHATGLRLGLDLGEQPFDMQLQKARLKGPGSSITHMLLLTDARQVNGDLITLLRAANARVNG